MDTEVFHLNEGTDQMVKHQGDQLVLGQAEV